MSYVFDSRLGEQLYRMLPDVYRTRDRYPQPGLSTEGSEDLARYLDVHGQLLDLIHATLEQQLEDTLPQTSQEWLLPYFAQLLAVNMVSPDAAGRQTEVSNAVSWRQRKGTLKVAEMIAESVAQLEAEIQEGWQRVALTPRIDKPLIPFQSLDSALELDTSLPSQAARHPSLPAAMIDFRQPSRAVEAQKSNPAAKFSTFGGQGGHWRQWNRHGTPCFPGSFDDVSRRTVDLRTPVDGNGHYHPKRLLAYVPPPDGLIPPEPIQLTWSQRLDSLYEHLIEEYEHDGVRTVRNRTTRVIEITDDVALGSGIYHIDGIHFAGELKVDNGGQVELRRVQAERLDVPTFSAEQPAVVAVDCLFSVLSAGGRVRLNSCTIVDEAFLTACDAQDCILMRVNGTDITGVFSHSRLPAGMSLHSEATVSKCSFEMPVFFNGQTALAAKAVLVADTPESILNGAGDGGEMGYFHNGRLAGPVRISGDFTGGGALTLPTAGGYPLADVIFEGRVEVASGTMELLRSAVAELEINSAAVVASPGAETPVLDAVDCLFDTVTAANALVRMEYCSVMQSANCKRLQASDCIFVGPITDAAGGAPESGCIRYSRVPPDYTTAGSDLFAGTTTNTRQSTIFARFDFCGGSAPEYRIAAFGETGYAVLDPHTADAIRFGAEDGGEMGVGHHRFYSLKMEAVLDKLNEFLPIGIEPVLVYDRRLLRLPPQIKNSSNGGSP